MNHEKPKVEKLTENPKQSRKHLEWKEGIVNKFKDLGMNISSDQEFFIIDTINSEGRPIQVKIHAWEKIPTKGDEGGMGIEDAIKKYL